LSCTSHKYIDDTTLTEIFFPGQSSQIEESWMNFMNGHNYANNMQINKQKTKEMIITTSRTASVPLYPDIQRIETFKLLDIAVDHTHCLNLYNTQSKLKITFPQAAEMSSSSSPRYTTIELSSD